MQRNPLPGRRALVLRGARAAAALAAGVAVATAGAASAAASAQARHARVQITVLAAASLTDVLPRIDGRARYSFAGSDTLAGQIRLGAPADVFASANTTLPGELYTAGLVEKPVVFTANRLVLVTPRSNPAGITSVFDLHRSGIKLLVGSATVPIGSYTRKVLARLALGGVLENAVSEESDVRSILGKLGLGEADAGFVYASDAKAAAGKVSVIALPERAQPQVCYAVAVLRSSRNRSDAIAFVDRLLAKAGQAKLRAAGFLAPKGLPASYGGG